MIKKTKKILIIKMNHNSVHKSIENKIKTLK